MPNTTGHPGLRTGHNGQRPLPPRHPARTVPGAFTPRALRHVLEWCEKKVETRALANRSRVTLLLQLTTLSVHPDGTRERGVQRNVATYVRTTYKRVYSRRDRVACGPCRTSTCLVPCRCGGAVSSHLERARYGPCYIQPNTPPRRSAGATFLSRVQAFWLLQSTFAHHDPPPSNLVHMP